jgi:high-affinity Fe2+/Pb2+ permease
MNSPKAPWIAALIGAAVALVIAYALVNFL